MTPRDLKRLLTLVPLLAAATLVAGEAPPRKTSLAAASPRARASAPRDGRYLRLAAAVFDPVTEVPDFASAGLPEKPDSPDYGVVQFLPDRLDEKERLAKLGVRFFGYLPDNAYQVLLSPRAVALLRESPAVRWTGTWAPGFKVHPRLRPGSQHVPPEITVQLFPGVPLDEVSRDIRARVPAATQTMAREDPVAPRLRFDVPASAAREFVREASAVPGVAWLEPYESRRVLNNDSLGPTQSNQESNLSNGSCATCSIFLHGVTGTGQIVAVADSGCDTDMCFFRTSEAAADVTDADDTAPPATGNLHRENKVIAYWVQPGATAYDNDASCEGESNAYHGTHTSGTAVGDDDHTPSTPSFPGIDVGDGMAPNAQLLFQDIGNDATGCLDVRDDYALYLQALSGGARIHSNSTGNDTRGDYTTIDQDADRFLFDHEEMAIFFAAGNSGPTSTSTGSPANAKNGIAVGAVGHGNSTSLATFSSRGPTADGRIKPDVVAAGSGIWSAAGDWIHTSANCGKKPLSGTSMSCPTAAGASALLRQYFADGFYPTGSRSTADEMEPSAALVKAVLLNGTLPLGSGPGFGNTGYGWGRVYLDNNLYFDGDARKLRVWSLANPDGLRTGESHTYMITVGAGEELRVTLAWSDVEGTLGAAQALVNDLDLTVTDGTRTWRGNVFADSGDSVPGGEADRRNTVEQVKLSAPDGGIYVITVRATNVPGSGRADTDRQGYALVASMAACASRVAAAPIGLSAASNAVMGVDLSFTRAPSSAVTQVYRAPGGCDAGPEAFRYVGQTAGGFFTDARAQGGVTYSYRVRGADGCGEGPAGECVTITPSGRCDRKPAFAGVSSASAVGSDCRIRLTWAAGSTSCGTGTSLRYNVFRSDALSPSIPGTWIGSVTGLEFEDRGATPGRSFLYVVRAEDSNTGGTGSNGGNEETNTVSLMAAASGPPGAFGTWSDDGGDGGGAMSGEPPWQITTTEAASGSHSYHAGPESGAYPGSTCASLMTPRLALGAGSILSYSARYDLEWQWDGVVVEISTDDGTTWTGLPPTTPAGYPDTLAQTSDPPSNACGLPSTQGAFTGPIDNPGLTVWTRYQTSLSPAYDGRTVRIRWRLTSDSNVEYEGFFLDAISVTNVRVPGACTAVPNSPPSGRITAPSGSVSVEAGLEVAFAGTGNDPDPYDGVRYRWTFGDGSPDATVAVPPPHPFARPGSYTVTLTVTDFRGASVSDSRTVTVGAPLVAGTSLFVPVVTDTDGANGSHYVSEVTVASHAGGPIPVLLAYTAAAGAGTGYARLTLGPGEQRVLPAAIDYLRSRNLPIPSDASSKIGTLLITFGVTSPGQVFAGTRTYTRDPSGGDGTFGLFYPDSGVSNTSITVFGLQQNDSQRSNLALQNVGASPVTLHSDILGPSGESLGGFDTALPPYGWFQKNLPLAGTGAASGRARITRVAGTSLFAAYGVLNDAVTSDGSFMTPLIPRGGPAAERLVPIVVSAGGYSSELTLTNLTAAPLPLSLTYTASSQPGFSPDGSGTATLTLQPGEQRIEPDALAFLRRIGLAVPSGVNAGGALLVAGPPGNTADDFAVGARTFTAGPSGGSFGLFYAGLSPAETAAEVAYVHGLQQNGRFRSNLAVVNRGDASDGITLRIAFYDASGAALPNIETRTLQPGEWFQLNQPLASRGADAGWARIERMSGRSRFAAYGVLNDSVNSDGSYVPMTVP
jgi:hypothetical protein